MSKEKKARAEDTENVGHLSGAAAATSGASCRDTANPAVNLQGWHVGLRGNRVEALRPAAPGMNRQIKKGPG